MIELKLTAESAKDLAKHLQDLAAMTGAQPAAAKVEPEPKPEPKPEPEPEEKPKRRKRRTKAQIEADKKAEEEAKAAAEAEAEAEAEEPSEDLAYEKDIRPLMTELVNQPDGGREKAVEILKAFKVANGKDLKVEDLPKVKKMAEEALASLQDDEDFL